MNENIQDMGIIDEDSAIKANSRHKALVDAYDVLMDRARFLHNTGGDADDATALESAAAVLRREQHRQSAIIRAYRAQSRR